MSGAGDVLMPNNSGAPMRTRAPVLLALVIVIGVTLRLSLPLLGHNFDVESYRIVADIMGDGGNVYAETSRYNYGPIWFLIVHGLDMLPGGGAGDPAAALHFKIAAFLTLVDIGLFAILYRRYSLAVGALFFLNPVSILITGYHSQFDNLAVFLGFAAVVLFDRVEGTRGKAALLVCLGLSLIAKHLLFLFPLWLAMRRQGWMDRILVLTIPYGLFAASFVPYLRSGLEGILANVFLYRSQNNAPLWRPLLPDAVFEIVPLIVFFVGAMLAIGWLMRERTMFDQMRAYFIALVVFSSAIANQYLAIPATSIAASWNLAYAAFSQVGTLVLFFDANGLALGNFGWTPRTTGVGYTLCVVFLAIGLVIDVSGKSPRELVAGRLQGKRT